MLNTSKYNRTTPFQNKLLVFNSYSGKLGYADFNSAVASFLLGREDYGALPNWSLLEENHFAIKPGTDEDRLAEMKLFDFIYEPKLELVIMPTMQCNFRCAYCYEKFDSGGMTEESIASLIKYLRQNLNQYSELSVSWFGGEPLMALPQMECISEQAIRLCSLLKIPYRASIVTNGSLVTPEVVNRLLKIRVYQMQITVDGLQAEHDKTRKFTHGQGSFDIIYKNLMYIKDHVASPALQIKIRCNVSKANLNQLGEYLDFMGNAFGADRRFQFYFQPVEDWGGNAVTNLKDELIQNPERFFDVLSAHSSSIQSGDNFKQLMQNTMCHSVKKNHYVITPDLKLLKCTVDLYSPQNRIGELVDGHMLLNMEQLAYWSFHTLPIHSACKEACAMYANCFTRNCPARTFGMKTSGCPAKVEQIEKKLCMEYQCNPQKFIEL